jgi:hypothetical protein
MFTPDPIPRPAGPPASSAPVHDYLAQQRPGADDTYVVLPRSLVEAMPLPWQQHMTYLLSEFHQAFSHVTWPVYRVVPSRYEKLVDLDEEQLAEVGCLVEIDAGGELVYRDRGGRVIENPEDTTVLVSCLDPIPPPRQPVAAPVDQQPPPGTPPQGQPPIQQPSGQPPAPFQQPQTFQPGPFDTLGQSIPPGAPGRNIPTDHPFGPTGSRPPRGTGTYPQVGPPPAPGQHW